MATDIMTASLDEQLAFINRINAQVNAVNYDVVASDDAMDAWFDSPIPGHVFECRCYAAMKGRLMREQGWDHEQMGFVLLNIEPPTREYHCVQYARTSGGVYIMDNRVMYPPHVYLWNKPVFDYQYLHQQDHPSPPGTILWRDARGGLI